MLAERSFDDLESMGLGHSLPCSPTKSCTNCQSPRSSSSADARRALWFCDMSCVALRLRMAEFVRQRCAEPVASSYQPEAAPETLETLVSLLQGRRVLQRILAFDTKGSNTFVRLLCTSHQQNGMGPLGCSTQIVSASLCVRLQMCKRLALVC